jgi:hypothetical protein
MAFVLSLSATHFYLYYDNSVVPTPAELMLAVDNKPIARLPVIEHQLEPSGKHVIVADLPGDMLLRQVVPSMLNGKMLSIAAGQHRYPMPISRFRIVMQEIVDCGRRVGAIVGRPSSNNSTLNLQSTPIPPGQPDEP